MPITTGECLTPDATYHIGISETGVAVRVQLPPPMVLPVYTEEQATQLEEQLHDAVEGVLAKFFDPNIGALRGS